MQRNLIVILVLVFLSVSPAAAEAQQPKAVSRVGLLSTINSRNSTPALAAFEQCMRELGYVEGQNWVFDFRNAEGQIARLPDLAADLARLPVDVIIAPGPEATLQAAYRATSTIPIVTMAVNYDPVTKGYIDSLAQPGGNVTGVFFMQIALSGKRLSLLKEMLPQLTRVFALYDTYSAGQLAATETAAQSLGLQLQSLELDNPPYDFDKAMSMAVSNQAQAVVVLSSPVFYGQRGQVAASTAKHRLPAIFLFRSYTEAGGLMSYGVNINDLYCQATVYIDRILKGAKPAELPVEQPTRFELVINLKAAKALGLTIPAEILFQATEVIQ